MNTHCFPRLARLILLTVLLTSPVRAHAAAQTTGDDAAVRPELRDEIAAATDGELSHYDIDIVLDPAASTLSGETTVRFVNQTDVPLAEVYFRLYPNAEYYGEGALTIDAVAVAGDAAVPDLSVGGTVLRVPLAEPIAPDRNVAIALDFTTTVPVNSTGSFGILNRASLTDTWILADWYPTVAAYEADEGWYLDPPTAFGDPTFPVTAFYDVTIAAPADLTLVASGSSVSETRDLATGTTIHEFETGPAREFTVVADQQYDVQATEVDGTTVTVYSEPSPNVSAVGEIVLETAVDALAWHSEWFGAYPYQELDLVQTPLAGALGVSWSGLIFLDPSCCAVPGALTDKEAAALAFTVAHEVGHQWWGGSVGANSNDHTFMVEGLTNYLAVVFFEETAGADAGAAYLAVEVVAPYETLLLQGIDAVADVPIGDAWDPRALGPVLYGKAALGFLAIRQQIGDPAFFTALAAYAADHAFAIAEPTDLLGTFEAASGQELDALWHVWFEAAETTLPDLERLIETG